MQRQDNWPEALADYLSACRLDPPAEVDHASFEFVLGAIESMTGIRVDIVEPSSDFGLPVQATLARRGDVVAFDDEEGLLYGVCDGYDALFSVPEGLVRVPLSQCDQAWTVG